MRKILTAVILGIFSGFALYGQGKEFITTGSGIRIKKVAFVSVKVCSVTHQMKEPVTEKSPRTIVQAETDKRFILKKLSDVESDKVENAIYDAYSLNGNTDNSNQGKIINVLKGDLKEGFTITISYYA